VHGQHSHKETYHDRGSTGREIGEKGGMNHALPRSMELQYSTLKKIGISTEEGPRKSHGGSMAHHS